ncbi:MAG: SulP family inorganic anion transporter [Alphaproteobacteria bacterium]|nr:SulP family inorganic anion transporter [Alphaproteobacteria bacterium]
MHTQYALRDILRNAAIGLAVSFVAISLGASLGILSGRGAFAGMISAGIIALITSAFGGTRIQCSGPTAPMSAISAIVVAFAFSDHAHAQTQLSSDQFITLVFLMTGGLLVLMGLFRTGRLIRFIPNVVISGFMNGIALLIWLSQIKVLFGVGGKAAVEGPLAANILIAAATIFFIFAGPVLFKKYAPRLAVYIPGTLLSIVLVTALAALFHAPVQYASLEGALDSLTDIHTFFAQQWPDSAVFSDVMVAGPYALKLAILCYLDTLLTSLVIDRMTGEKTARDRELCAQGAANACAAIVGGIPGAQATIRSILLVKEGATLRLAGMCAGAFVFVEIFIFRDVFSMIPSAVFIGILFKVGYDVLDLKPLGIYVRGLFGRSSQNSHMAVGHMELIFIAGTTLVTVLYDLNAAVLGFTALFYFANKTLFKEAPIPDLLAPEETEGVTDEG